MKAIFDGLLRQLPKSFLSDSRRTVVGLFSWSDLRWTSSPTSKFYFEQSSTHIGCEIFVERSSTDFFGNFQNLFWGILDAHRMWNLRGAIFDGLIRQLRNSTLSDSRRTLVVKFSWSDLRWTSSPTFKFYVEQSSTHIGCEIFVERSSTDFFANFQILLWAILDAHWLWNFRWSINAIGGESFQGLIDVCIRTVAFYRTACMHHSLPDYDMARRIMYTHGDLPSNGVHASQPTRLRHTTLLKEVCIRTMAFHGTACMHHSRPTVAETYVFTLRPLSGDVRASRYTHADRRHTTHSSVLHRNGVWTRCDSSLPSVHRL